MTRSAPPQVAFSAGEIDPLLHRRFDYRRFQTGLAACRGYLPLPQGGFTRQPGTVWRGNTRADQAGRLVPFVFAVNDAVVLEFTAFRMRVWRYGAPVLSAGVPYELTTPYDAAALARLSFSQSADVIRITDGVLPMQRLARLALDNWTIGAQVFDTGPFRVANLDKALTLQASAETGSVTLTANTARFVAAHVGSLIRLEPTDSTDVALWISNTAVSVGAIRRYGENVYELLAGTNTGDTPPQHTDGDEMTDATTKWRFLSDNTGIVRITAVASPPAATATATVIRRIPKACVLKPTYRWAEGAWSDLWGNPAVIAEIAGPRLAAAATPSEPRTLWASAIGDFGDFGDGVEADEAFAYTIAGDGSVNRIQNLHRGKRGLHIFALGEELSARPATPGQAIGPTNFSAEPDSAVGSSPARPIAPYGEPIFISRDRRQLLQMGYNLQKDGNDPIPLSLPSQHLGASGFAEVVWQPSPLPLAWVRRDSGDLVAMLYQPSEEVTGWAVCPLAGGAVESLCVTPDATGTRDVVTMIVRRTVLGETVRFVEEMSPFFAFLTGAADLASVNHLFAAAVFAPVPPQAVFAVPHLIGQTVRAWTEAGDFGGLTVANNGNVTLPAAVSRAIIGLEDTTQEAVTLDITAAAPEGSAMGRDKRMLAGVGVGLHATAQGAVQVIETVLPDPPVIGAPVSLIALPVAAALNRTFSGVVRVEAAGGGAKEIQLRFTPVGAAPMTVTAAVPIMQEAGR
jgi:hypothetical protein